MNYTLRWCPSCSGAASDSSMISVRGRATIAAWSTCVLPPSPMFASHGTAEVPRPAENRWAISLLADCSFVGNDMSAADVSYAGGVRWQPDSRGRLEVAALELYLEQGFENTTVAEIAQRAGLTERTFFRYFTDKREVLFPGGETFENLITDAAAAAPAELGPLEATFVGLEAVSSFLKERRSFAQKRQRIISTTAELQERGIDQAPVAGDQTRRNAARSRGDGLRRGTRRRSGSRSLQDIV